MRVAVPKERAHGERRVALTPDAVSRLTNSGIDVTVENGAGENALFFDEAYRDARAEIAPDAPTLYKSANVVLKVRPPETNELEFIEKGSVLIGFLNPSTNLNLVKILADRGITSFSMEAIPRIARAQRMDALTSMASIAGYKAALIAADSLDIFLPMMITAAGTIPPAKGLVLGAGVAGLQAIATARRLGAVMYGYDVRPAVKEQVQSLGGRFIESEAAAVETEGSGGYARELAEESQTRERELIHRNLKDMDFVITTAAIPGRAAPILITREMVSDMKPGSVIVDVAAETGGNCEATVPGENVNVNGVLVCGPLNLPSSMAVHASQMYSRNVSSLLQHLTQEGEIHLDFEDEITRGCCITHAGQVVNEPTLALLQGEQRDSTLPETNGGGATQ